jgi:pSer/pThr/pTyr-binding forkhead associated (FHA) protein
VIRSGELVRVGRIWLELTIEPVPVTDDAPLATRELALALVSSALAAQGEAAAVTLKVEQGPDAGKQLALAELGRVYVIGRGPSLDLTLSDVDTSRRHLEVWRRGAALWIKDLGSKNGVSLDDAQLPPNKDTVWARGKRVRLGGTELSFDDPVTEALVEIEASSDENMRDGDAVDPPTEASAAGVGAPVASPFGAAPIARVPQVERRAPPRATGFRTADLVIAALALAVLAASTVGLFWLFRLK